VNAGEGLVVEIVPNGVEGVKRFLEYIKKAMIMTSCDCLDNIMKKND